MYGAKNRPSVANISAKRGQHHGDGAESTPLTVDTGQLLVANQFAVYRTNSQVDERAEDEDSDVNNDEEGDACVNAVEKDTTYETSQTWSTRLLTC